MLTMNTLNILCYLEKAFVSYFVLYILFLTVYFSRWITPVGEERAVVFLLSITADFVFSVRRCLPFGVIDKLWHLSPDVRKQDFCICENKDADQLRGNREADQRLCFRYTDSTIPLLPKYEISIL